MAGQARNRGSRGSGGPDRRGSSWPVLAGASAVVSGSPAGSVQTAPDPQTPRAVATRAPYRLLMMRGLASDEAANLTAYMCGLPVGEGHWTIGQINRLLFLRELNRSGRFGDSDGAEPTH